MGSLAETNPTCAHCHTHRIKGDCCSAAIIPPPDTQTEKSGTVLLKHTCEALPRPPDIIKALTSPQSCQRNPSVSLRVPSTHYRGLNLGALGRICGHHGSRSTWVKGSTCSGAAVGSIGHLQFLLHFTFQKVSFFSKADLHLLSV